MTPDHSYVWTIAGRCGRQDCGQVETAHPRLLSKVERERDPIPECCKECTVAHSSITASLLIGDGGLVWSKCPICQHYIEPKLPEDTSMTGMFRRSKSGHGRMPFTQRHWDEIVRLKAMFEAGYYLS